VLRAIIGDYFKRRGIEIVPTLEIDNYAMAISLVASRRGVALLPIPLKISCRGRWSAARSKARCRRSTW